MFKKSSAILLIAAFLETLPLIANGLYTRNSPVLQVDEINYNNLIAKSNHASIVEFYAPWCGHCKNLKPAYEKVAKSLEGLVKVAAVNCDDDSNKQFCRQMGVKGFPTLKVITPSKHPGKPRVDDYQGPRTAKAIVDYVVEMIPNHIKRLQDENIDGWLQEANDTAKLILFTEKGSTSALLRSLAIDYLGSISIAQIRNKETSAVETFGVNKFPTLVLLPGGTKEPITYDGEMKKQPISEFLSRVAKPNPDPAPTKSKKSKSDSGDDDDATTTSKTTESSEPSSTDSASTQPKTPPIPTISTDSKLREACLAPKTGTCVLALVAMPEKISADTVPAPGTVQALNSLAEIAHKHSLRKSHLFPFYTLPDAVKDVGFLRSKLELKHDVAIDIIALNVKRGWWRHYDAGADGDWSVTKLEAWIDAIRMGEGAKTKLPEGIVPDEEEQKEKKEPRKEATDKQPEKETEKELEQGEKNEFEKEEPTGHSEL
ncbi:protein disulfide-isomerase [Blastomyces gilchristii SLH14081]|uniref:protein disulfide-isomerase n=1 Tax=Blastomyces gilchristii (strain SLH14081) TaxID=559298 RepID=A0A179V3D2_BLAGS|nr:protein disulfide-isomerase [Blastomyces gilchristii SLH14081]OAT13938.1 protein disulfide-isomerase [Blastomyces gilchristii SLH14081]